MNAHKNILIIRFKSIGDVIFTLPAVHAVREAHPNARISFLTVSEMAPLLEGFGDVDEVIVLNRKRLKKPATVLPELFGMLRRLRAGRFSLAIDLQGYGETAFLTFFTGAKERWGSVYREGRRWAYTNGVDRIDTIHPVDWNRLLLEKCGMVTGALKNDFQLPESAREAARKLFAEHGLDPAKPTLFIQPFTSNTFKNWPLENYLAVARHWRSSGVQVAFGGGPGDVAPLEPARAESFAVLAGSPLLVTGGLMQLSTLVLGGDTGMLHLAIALGKRAVMTINNIRPGAPILYGHPEWILSPPVEGKIEGIPVEAVIAETGKALKV
jgi:ADP-heptose:LPS heptosyltransferase